MFARLRVLLLLASLLPTIHCESDMDVSSRKFQKFEPSFSVILGLAQGTTRSKLACGASCDRSSACKAFCYSQSTALCYQYPSIPPASAEPTQNSEVKCFAECPVASGYTMYGTRCIKGHTLGVTWDKAKVACEQNGGHLYHFKTLQDDQQPLALLTDAMGDLDGFWVGANDLDTEGEFVWGNATAVNASAVDGDLWAPNRPNGGATYDKDCTDVSRSTLLLSDRLCTQTRDYVCQIDV